MKAIDFSFIQDFMPLLDRIHAKKQKVDSARPLPMGAVKRIQDDLALEWTYNSNGIEGNTLTLVETKVVIHDGMTVGGKSLREHFEAINHDKAITYIESLAHRDYLFRSIDILKIHDIVLHHIEDDFKGRIRNGMVRIQGANFMPPSPEKVSDLLDELIDFINQNHDLDICVLAAILHHRFVWIHPFFDGNGRTARLVMNLYLLKHGFPPAIILKNDRKKYYDALNLANKGDYTKMTLLTLQAIERSLNLYLQISPKDYAIYEPLSQIAKEPEIPYGMEYISLLARSGKIDAYKEGRIWMTTKKAVLNYAQSD